KYDHTYDFSEGLALVVNNNNAGYIDASGEYKIEPTLYYDPFSSNGNFSNGLAPAKKSEEEKWGYINKKGEFVIPPIFDYAYDFSGEIACIKEDSKFGYIDINGEYLIKPKYEVAKSFFEELALVKEEGNEYYGYINKKGEMVIAPTYIYMDQVMYGSYKDFPGNISRVMDKNNYWGYIDKNTGEFIWKINEEKVEKRENEIITGDKKEYDFFGTWEFVNTLPGYISAMSQEQVDKLIGQRVEFSNDKVFSKTYDQVIYEIKDIPIAKFRDGNKISDDWDINPDSRFIHEIIIYNNYSKNKEIEWEHEEFGANIYYVDSRLIMDIEGVFFELKRVRN
ncbi:MAG: WG repeat-containing protein, partial [bacterium]